MFQQQGCDVGAFIARANAESARARNTIIYIPYYARAYRELRHIQLVRTLDLLNAVRNDTK